MQPEGPIEVWLSQRNMQVTCTVVHEDESTRQLDISSLSMRGAEREITGDLIGSGYAPVGRWETEEHDDDRGAVEVMRKFVPAKSK
jgi:hypothetical protein